MGHLVFDPEPGREPGFLWQQNTLRDALVAALNFHVFHAHAKRVQMANIAQMVNVLQAMILTDGPTHDADAHLSRLRDVHPVPGSDVPADGDPGAEYALGQTERAGGDVSRRRAIRPGKLHVGLVNLDPKREAVVTDHVTVRT